MKKTINLNSKEWCDIIFKGKNKSYGAYEMRISSSRRHIAAFGITVLIAIAIVLIPSLINTITAATKGELNSGIDQEREMSVIEFEPEEELIVEMNIPEPPVYKEEVLNSIVFNPPIIGEDSAVPEELETKTMEEILGDNRAVGYIDVSEGTDNRSAELLRTERIIIDEPVETMPRDFAEIMPQFPGGNDEMMSFISKILRYPVIDQENGVQGRVTIRFVVTKTGEIDQVEVLRGVSSSCDREAIRVVKQMPRWIPGRQNGKPVAVYFTLPVMYRLK